MPIVPPAAPAVPSKTVTPAPGSAPAAPGAAPGAVPVAAPVPPGGPQPEAAKAAAEAAAKKAEEAKLARSFAQLSKKEQETTAARKALAAERAEIARQKAEIEAFNKAKAEAKRNPIAYLQAAGLSYEDATAFTLNNNQPTPEMQTKAEIEEAKRIAREASEKLDEYKKSEEAARKANQENYEKAKIQEYQQKRQAFFDEAVAMVKGDAVSYEYTNLLEAEAEVPQLVELHYQQTGKLISVKEAAQMVESHLEGLVEKAVASEKWKKKVVEAAKAPKPQPATGGKQEEPQKRTVDNSLSEPAAPPKPKKGDVETEEARMERAKLAFKKARGEA